ncbi:unnamed protein product, partial [Brenthis ino]
MSSNSQETYFFNAIPPFRPSNAPASPTEQPRQPRNLQGLLRFAMEATKSEDAPGTSDLSPMDEERRKFLEEALKAMSVDVAEMLQDAIKLLKDVSVMNMIKRGEEIPDNINGRLNQIMDYVDDIDVANDFKKIGGFAIFPVCFGCDNDEVRSKTSSIIGTICQNNPPCQTKAIECGLLGLLIHLANSALDSNTNSNLFGKYLYGISGIIRGFDPAIKQFIELEGLELLMKALQGSNMTAKTRAAFIVQHLCPTNSDVKDFFIKQNLVKIAAEEIHAGQNEATEHLLSMLQSLLASNDPKIMEQCNNLELNFKGIIQNHLMLVEKDDTYMEERDYCKTILTLLDKYSQYDLNEEVDRNYLHYHIV